MSALFSMGDNGLILQLEKGKDYAVTTLKSKSNSLSTSQH